jgi:hypothetical protein
MSLFIGFIVAFSSVALYHLPYALDNVNAIPNEPINPGASSLTPGDLTKQIPTEPIKPGATSLTPGIQFNLVPPNPVQPGASGLFPGFILQNPGPT